MKKSKISLQVNFLKTFRVEDVIIIHLNIITEVLKSPLPDHLQPFEHNFFICIQTIKHLRSSQIQNLAINKRYCTYRINIIIVNRIYPLPREFEDRSSNLVKENCSPIIHLIEDNFIPFEYEEEVVQIAVEPGVDVLRMKQFSEYIQDYQGLGWKGLTGLLTLSAIWLSLFKSLSANNFRILKKQN